MLVCGGHPGWQAELSLCWESRRKPVASAGRGEGEDKAAPRVGPVLASPETEGLCCKNGCLI